MRRPKVAPMRILPALQESVKSKPDDALARIALGTCRAQLGDIDKGDADLSEALSTHGKDPDVYVKVGVAYYSRRGSID